MNTIRPPSVQQNRLPIILIVAGLGFTVAYVICSWLLWHNLPFFPLPGGSPSWGFAMKSWFLSIFLHRLPAGQLWPTWLDELGRYAYLFQYRISLPLIPSFLVAAMLGWIFHRASITQDALIHIRGRRLLTGKEAASAFGKESRHECKVHGEGLRMHPLFSPLSLDRETRHILVMGSVGGGKTQVIKPLMQAARMRKDKVFIYDNKGDFSAEMPGVIVAPWDARSVAWDIASDCTSKQDAKELAARLIVESKDPLWSNAARQVLTGMVIKLQSERPRKWTWQNLADLIPLPQDELLIVMQKYFPEGIRAVEEASKTTQSILINLSAFAGIIFDLADAWGTSKKRFSFVNWLKNQGREAKVSTVIVQGSGRFAELQKAYIGGIIAAMASRINSAEIGESKTRRVWFFLDEFAQLGKVSGFAPLLEIGRSKGIRVVIGLQDINQIRDLYGKEQAESWMSMIGTQIYARISPGETADFVSGLVGDREVERPNISHTLGSGAAPGVLSPGGTTTTAWQRETLPVLLPSELSTELGSTEKGIKALFLGYTDALILLWPYTSLKKIREPSILADWTTWPDRPPVDSVVPVSVQPATTEIQPARPEEDSFSSDTPSQKAPVMAPAIEIEREQTSRLDADLVGLLEPSLMESEVSNKIEGAVKDDVENEIGKEIGKEVGVESMTQVADAILPGSGAAVHIISTIADAVGGNSGGPVATPIQQTRRKILLKKKRQEESRERNHDEEEELC